MMDSNKDEALRCVGITQEAIAIGNKECALKFIKIAQRLNPNLSVDVLLAMREKLDFPSPPSSSEGKCFGGVRKENGSTKSDESLNGEEIYTEEHVRVIKQIKGGNDYDAVLGVEKSCSVDEIRRACRKLSLKVHPDKNKAPGSEDA